MAFIANVIDGKPMAEAVDDIGRQVSRKNQATNTIEGKPEYRVQLTEEDSGRICRKTDKVILALLVWVYFLQILDKTVLGYAAIFGLKEDTGLVGNQYSFLGSIAPIAQLAWQPFSSFLIVRVPHRILMPALCLGWGIAQASMAACYNYRSLLVARFFLGLFEGGCLPLFSIITAQWYRRAEQPIRVAAWYSSNGIATMVASALSYGLGHIPSETLKSWQIIFLFVGLVTIITAPFVYWKMDDDVASARFLTPHEREQGIERLRANQTGTGSREFKSSHIVELVLEPKSYIWIGISLLNNAGAAVANTFGPLILNGLGYDPYMTSLLNIPFGAVQFVIIMLASWAAQRAKIKSAVIDLLVLPVIAGLVVLYVLPRGQSHQAALIVAYYLLAFLFGGNPLIVSWIVGNTGGATKKSVMMALYNAGSSSGNILGPLLFSDEDKPAYLPGLRKCLGIFCAMFVIVLIQVGVLFVMNQMNRRKRIRAGKKADIRDRSMETRYVAADVENIDESGHVVGETLDLDPTDGKNDEFVYIY